LRESFRRLTPIARRTIKDVFDQVLRTIRRIPKGKVATYGDVAAASGYPGAARQVVWALRTGKGVPWHRVLGAKGMILLKGEAGFEQRLRLRTEGVIIGGDRVDLKRFGHVFRRVN
jgi:methylated-DNA-protein-cysteine methyltransferase-like protein